MKLMLVCLVLSFSLGAQNLKKQAPLSARDGFAGVLEAFQTANIVALPDRHQDSKSSKFRIDLVTRPAFGAAVNDIVIEWGNRLYQNTLDLYIAGEEVSEVDLQKIWRNTVVVNGTWDSPLYREFLSAVRNANKHLPTSRRTRVLAGDPPIDWAHVERKDQWMEFATRRDESVLTVLEQEVLAKRHRALLIMGSGHLLRGVTKEGPGVIDLFERAHAPDRIFVIGISPSIARQLDAYPQESFFFTKGTWLEDLSAARGKLIYDGLLILPHGNRVPAAASTYADREYFQVLDRRCRMVLGKPYSPSEAP